MSKQEKYSPLKRADYLRYLFTKHHVTPGSQVASFDEVIHSVVGVHSARLPTPYVAFQARMTNLTPADYRVATFDTNHLIKLRCMRKTLHTVTQELAPIVHMATLPLRVVELESKINRIGIARDCLLELMREIVDTAVNTPQSHNYLLKWTAGRIAMIANAVSKAEAFSIARLIIKLTWENGHICYINRAKHWSRELRFYGSTRRIYPKLSFDLISRKQAVRELVSRHIKAFGPVSEKDIAWWSGIRVTEVRTALIDLSPTLVRVDLEGVSNDLLMELADYNQWTLFQRKSNGSMWCAFLAYEDPTLKGYFETRSRYVDAEHYNKLFNQIGEVRPSIIINGRVVGIWSWSVKTSRISVRCFRILSERENSLLAVKRQELEKFLDETSQLNLFPSTDTRL